MSRGASLLTRSGHGKMGIMSLSETGIVAGGSSAPDSSQETNITDIDEIEEISEIDPPAGDSAALGPAVLSGGNGNGQSRAELPADRYLDREQSWVQFNQRVLELAEDDQTPLLERVRFLAIFASNLDEFFMVRVAGLMRRMAAGLPLIIPSGLTPDELLRSTLTKSRVLASRHAAVFADLIKPELARHDIEILRWKELTGSERADLAELFRNRIYPVLTPLVVDPAHPFPFISGLSLNLAVALTDPANGLTLFARVKVPPSLPRFLNVNRYRYVRSRT